MLAEGRRYTRTGPLLKMELMCNKVFMQIRLFSCWKIAHAVLELYLTVLVNIKKLHMTIIFINSYIVCQKYFKKCDHMQK